MEIYKPVAGTAADTSQVRILLTHVKDAPGNAALLFGKLAENNISVDMIIQSFGRTSGSNDIAFTVNKEDKNQTVKICESLLPELDKSGEVYVDEDIAKVSIVGAGMVDRPGIAAAMFRALADVGINIKMISTSEIKISVVIDAEAADRAVSAVHKAFIPND